MTAFWTHEPTAGTDVDAKYRLIRRIGRGGMGEVWKAQVLHSGTNDHVAVKLYCPPPDPLADKYARDAFNRELQLLLRLRSQNIVKVRDQGVLYDRPYFVMQLLTGHTLEQHIISEGKFHWRETLRLIGEIAKALMHLHQLDYVHRDLKPSNIFLETSGDLSEAYLLDFGIAAPVGGHDDGGFKTSILGENVSVGTPEYSAPEQLTGYFSPGTDLYALGVIAYRMLTGGLPFDVPRALQPQAHLFRAPLPIEATEVPHEVRQLVFELLEKDVSSRPSSAKDLHHRIGRLMATDFTSVSTYLERPRARPSTAILVGLFCASVVFAAVLTSQSNLLLNASAPKPKSSAHRLPPSNDEPADPPPVDLAPEWSLAALYELDKNVTEGGRGTDAPDLHALRDQLQRELETAPSPRVAAGLALVASKLGDCLATLRHVARFNRMCGECKARPEAWPLLEQARRGCSGELKVLTKRAGTAIDLERLDRPFGRFSPDTVDPFVSALLPVGRYRVIARKAGCKPAAKVVAIDASARAIVPIEADCGPSTPAPAPTAQGADARAPPMTQPALMPDSTPLGHLPFPSDDDQ